MYNPVSDSFDSKALHDSYRILPSTELRKSLNDVGKTITGENDATTGETTTIGVEE